MKINKKILIVEDEVSLLNVLRDEFVREGFEVYMAKDGQEGYDTAAAKHPDIILIDILMPKMDGITMFKKLRALPELKNTLGIVLTNLNDTETISKALENGAYDFLVKSDWEPKSLIKHVKEKLGII
ncbi:MAG: response regulator [Candidatus Doudnabacteria bacterium]|nr:response regulator [Candidatus Doudnabacteria bacterium]